MRVALRYVARYWYSHHVRGLESRAIQNEVHYPDPHEGSWSISHCWPKAKANAHAAAGGTLQMWSFQGEDELNCPSIFAMKQFSCRLNGNTVVIKTPTSCSKLLGLAGVEKADQQEDGEDQGNIAL